VAVATFVAVDTGGDAYWRFQAPAREIGARQEYVPRKTWGQLLTQPHDEGAFRWHLRLDWPDGTHSVAKTAQGWKRIQRRDEWRDPRVKLTTIFPDIESPVVFIRPDLARSLLAKSMREQHGMRTISEVDDNYMGNLHHALGLRGANWTSADQEEHLKALVSHNAIIFSTKPLRDTYDREIRTHFRKWFGPPQEWPPVPEFYVCRNHVAAQDWPELVERQGRLRVGWMGSTSHVWDMDMAWGALRFAKEAGAETWMIGYDPMDAMVKDAKLRGHDLHPRTQAKLKAWMRVGYKTIPWREFGEYERLALPLDIGLCPLLTNSHTLGKSDVKFLEYTISGAATIASNNLVYNRTIKHMETGILVGSDREMVDAVALLMKDEKLRQRLVENAQQYVREERGAKQMKQEWTYAVT
jgi:glycosyltransferase involved in cell wall biosynthesis